MAGRREYAVHVEGLAKLRRDLKAIDKGLSKELTNHIRDIARGARDDARALLRSRSKDPQGRIEKTIKHSVTVKSASIYSDHPGAPVNEFGGAIAPKGTPIEIKGKSFMRDAVAEKTGHVEDELARSLDVLAEFNGFR